MLMHTMTASRYLTIADLLEPPVWPMGVSLREDDVLVRGESLAQQARIATPAVRIGEAPPQQAQITPPRQRFVSLIIARVLAVTALDGHRPADVVIDADLSHCDVHFSDMRIVGRFATRSTARVRLHAPGGVSGPRARLPRDLAVGDILVIPCEGTVTPSDIRCRALARDPDQNDDAAPSCGRHIRGN